jgi:hypothetical protein
MKSRPLRVVQALSVSLLSSNSVRCAASAYEPPAAAKQLSLAGCILFLKVGKGTPERAIEPQQELALLTHKVPGEYEVSPDVRRRLSPVQQVRPLRGRDYGRTPQSERCVTQCGARPGLGSSDRVCCFRY